MANGSPFQKYTKDPIIRHLYTKISEHWPVTMKNKSSRDSLDPQDDDDDDDDSERPVLDDDYGDQDLATSLGVNLEAQPGVPLPDSQCPQESLTLPETFLDEISPEAAASEGMVVEHPEPRQLEDEFFDPTWTDAQPHNPFDMSQEIPATQPDDDVEVVEPEIKITDPMPSKASYTKKDLATLHARMDEIR